MSGSRLISAEMAFIRFIESFRDAQGIVKYEQALSEMPIKGLKSLIVDFYDLYAFDPDFASDLLANPDDLLPQFNIVAFQKLHVYDREYAEKIQEVHVRFRVLPSETPLRTIGAIHIGKFLKVNGIIVKTTAAKPLLMKAAFRCNSCGEITYMEQTGRFLRMPRVYLSCNRSWDFQLVPKESVFIDSQNITIQEPPPCQLPRQILVELRGDIVNFARLGDRVRIIGSVSIIKRQRAGGILRIFDLIIEANNIELIDSQLKFL